MLNDIWPNRFSLNPLDNPSIEDNDYCLIFNKGNLLSHREKSLLKFKDIKDIYPNAQLRYFGRLNDNNIFFCEDDDIKERDGFLWKSMHFMRSDLDKHKLFAVSVAHHLNDWYSKNKFCGRCGQGTEEAKDEVALVCPKCGNIIYPKISPAIIVAITKGDEILLIKGANYKIDFFTIVAGFTEIGETFEETVVREVYEEVGIEVKNVRYYKSQPWPFSGSIMVGYFAEYSRGEINIDPKEVLEAGWFKRDKLPNIPDDGISIAGEMIELFRRGEK